MTTIAPGYAFAVSGKGALDRIRRRLAAEARLKKSTKFRLTRYVLDTFDRRIANRGDSLIAEQTDAGTTLTFACANGETLTQRVETLPRFARDLPDNLFRNTLDKVIGVRALLPLARDELAVSPWQFLDDEGKTTLRLRVERPVADGPGSHRILRVLPLRGYPGARDRAVAMLSQEKANGLAIRPLTDDPLAAHVPPPPPQPEPPRFFAGNRSDIAVRSIFNSLRATILLNVEGTRANIDSEFLHDLRIALRRTRTLLGQMKSALPARRGDHFRKEFAWLGQATSGARDMDVFLLDFEALRALLPPQMRADLDPFRGYLTERDEREREILNEALDSARFRRLMDSWGRFLEAPSPSRPTAPDARTPIEQLSARRILTLYKRAVKKGRRIKPDSPPADLHELRKTCKRLRYLFEFFRHLHAPRDMERATKALKGLQDVLGRYQDLCVQIEVLEEFKSTLQRDPKRAPDPETTLRAANRLIDVLKKKAGGVRGKFVKRFGKFISPSLRACEKHLLETVSADDAVLPE